MTRVQFLNDLYKRISSLPEDQAEQHLTYYAEMLADRMEEGMSEEEAVASMEPVDVIVQRIFEDSPPPEQTAIQPPVYPDLPETDGSRFSKVPDRPKKRASISRIILWVIAIVVAIGAAGNKIRQYRHMIPDIPYVHETAVDYSSSPVTEVELVPAEDCGSMWEEADNLYSFGPDGIEINGTQIGPDGIFSDQEGIEISGGGIIHTPLSVSSRYAVLNDTYRTPDASSVEINWTSGAVDVCLWGGDTIEFQEYSGGLLPESQKLEYWIEDYTLKINDRVPGDKGLIVYIPAGFCSQLFVDTTSADVTLSGLRYLGSASVYTSSGDIGVYNSVVSDLNLSGSSGNAVLQGVAANYLSAELTSGNLILNGVAAYSMDVSLSSGDISGFAAGMSLEMETTSGEIDISASASEQLELEASSGNVQLTLADAYFNYVSAGTTSGNVTLVLPPDRNFGLNFDSASGILDKGPFSLVRSGGMYHGGDFDEFMIDVETSSGNLYLRSY